MGTVEEEGEDLLGLEWFWKKSIDAHEYDSMKKLGLKE